MLNYNVEGIAWKWARPWSCFGKLAELQSIAFIRCGTCGHFIAQDALLAEWAIGNLCTPEHTLYQRHIIGRMGWLCFKEPCSFTVQYTSELYVLVLFLYDTAHCMRDTLAGEVVVCW